MKRLQTMMRSKGHSMETVEVYRQIYDKLGFDGVEKALLEALHNNVRSVRAKYGEDSEMLWVQLAVLHKTHSDLLLAIASDIKAPLESN